MPVIPETIEEINIIDEWSKCLDGSRFLAYHQKKSVDPNKPNMIIFTSDNCLKILSKSQKWQSDGTFQVVPRPKGFYQLYIVHGYYKVYLLPCVYALLTGKDENHYKSLIFQLKEAALNVGLELKPTYLMIDFEKSTMNAFKYHFPAIIIICCFFHLSQNFFKKLVECGFKSQYSTNNDLKTWFKKIIALSLVPPEKVVDIFEELLLQMHDLFDLQGEYRELETFADYVLVNYIGDNNTPLFPISLWNHYESDDRTNNAGEAYNLRMNSYFGTHPSLWKFIRKLKQEESNTVLKFLRIENGTINSRGRNRQDMEKDDKINTCKIKYLQNKIDIVQYLEEISQLVAPKFD
jgi:hypothetical protein